MSWLDPPIEEPPTAAECLARELCGYCFESYDGCECEDQREDDARPALKRLLAAVTAEGGAHSFDTMLAIKAAQRVVGDE